MTAATAKPTESDHSLFERPLLDKLKKLLAQERPQETDTTRALQLASAVLLVEISYADFETDPRELKAAAARLAQRYDLPATEADALLSDALAEHKQSVSLHDYLKVINNNMEREQKAELVEDLWAIAYADDKLDCHEEHGVRKIAGLLHVSHAHFIRAKHRVQKVSRG